MFKYSVSDMIVIPTTILVIIIGSIIYSRASKNTKYNALPLKVFAVYLVLLEITKQIYRVSMGNYNLYFLPIHFCSLFMPLFLLSEFLPKKWAQYIKPMSVIYSVVLTVLLIVSPYSMITNSTSNIFGDLPNFVSFSYHFTIVAYLVYSIVNKSYVPRKRDCLLVIICLLIYISYAIPFAYINNANYANILYSSFSAVETFRLTYGQLAYNAVYFSVIIVALCILQLVYYAIYKLIEKIKFRVNNGKHKF